MTSQFPEHELGRRSIYRSVVIDGFVAKTPGVLIMIDRIPYGSAETCRRLSRPATCTAASGATLSTSTHTH